MRRKSGWKSYQAVADEVAQVVERTLATPPEIVARLTAIMGALQ